MEPQEEDLTEFQRCLSEVLKSLSFDCGLSQKKLGKILHKLERNRELDVNMIEDAGIKIIKFLSTLKRNIAMIIKTLDDGISNTNKNQNETLFEELSKELSIWKRSVVSINENEFTFTQVCDKETMVGGNKFAKEDNPDNSVLPCTSNLDQKRSPEDSIIHGDLISDDLSADQDTPIQQNEDVTKFIYSKAGALISETELPNTSTVMDKKKCDQPDTDNNIEQCNDSLVSQISKKVPIFNSRTLENLKQEMLNEHSSSESVIARESICLSLKTEPNLSDTQNTDDDWNDTLRRDSHKKSFENVLVKFPKEEDNFDTETLQLNKDEIPDDDLADFKIEPSQSFEFNVENEAVNIINSTTLKQTTQQCHAKKEDTNDHRESSHENLTDEIQCKIAEDRRQCPKVDDEAGIVPDSEIENVVEDEIDSEFPREVLDKSEIVSSSALNENIHMDKSESSCSECSEGKPIHKDNSDVDKISQVTVVNSKESIKSKDNDPICSKDQIEDGDTSYHVVGISSIESNILKNKNHDSNSNNHQTRNDTYSSDDRTTVSSKLDLHKERNRKLPISNGQLEDTDLSDTISISSRESDIVMNEDQAHISSKHQFSHDVTKSGSVESGTDNEKNSEPISRNDQTEDMNSSDDELYKALTQKISKEMNGIDSPAINSKKDDDDNILLKPTQIIINRTKSHEANIDHESSIEKSPDKLKNDLDDSSNNKLERASERRRSFEKSVKTTREVDHITSVNVRETITNELDDDNDGLSRKLLSSDDSSLNDETMLNCDVGAKTQNSNHENRSSNITGPDELSNLNKVDCTKSKIICESDDQCQNKCVTSSSTSGSIKSNADIVENSFSDETVEFDSDEEIEKNGFLNEHSYSCATTSDVEDSLRELTNGLGSDENKIHNGVASTNKDYTSETETCYIHGEHNYSSPGCLSDGESLENNGMAIANDSDSDVTDIDQVTEDMLAIPHSHNGANDTEKTDVKDNLADGKDIPNSQSENAIFSQESSNSYEFDVTENVNHLDAEENDTTSKRSTSRSSQIIDEWYSGSSSASSKKIDYDSLSNDEMNESLCKIDAEEELRKRKNLDIDHDILSDDDENATLCHIDTEDELRKQKSLDIDHDNVSNDEENATLCQIDTEDELRKQKSLDIDHDNVFNDDENATRCQIYTEDELCKQESLDIDHDNVSNDEVNATICEITTEGQVSKRNSPDDRQVQQNNSEESTCKDTANSPDMKEKVTKELENISNKNLEETKTEDHHILQVEEEIKEESDEENDVAHDESTFLINEDDKQKDSEHTILIENDGCMKESLMDMIMEEFLSDTEKAPGINDSEGTIILDCDDIKVESEEPDVQIIESNVDIGDEILSLLKEVESPIEAENKGAELDDAVQADNILKMFQEYKESDSESTEDSSTLSDSSLEIVGKNQIAGSENQFAQVLKEHNMVDCFVKLDKLNLSANDIHNHEKYLEDNLEWLCDLTTLQNKRKYPCPASFQQARRLGNKRRSKSYELVDSASSSSSDVEISGYRSGTPVLPQDLQNKMDDMLANSICKELRKDGKSSSSSSDDSDDSVSKKKKMKANKTCDDVAENGRSNNDTIDEDNSKKVLSKEELKKRAWKNDPLLKGRLLSNSGSDGNETSNPKRKRKKRRYEHTEISIDSDKLDSDSDTDVFKNNKSKLEGKEISPIKRNIPVSDDSDSDIEFVPQKIKTPIKSDDEFGPSQKGRRNIRALLSEDTLAEATKKANKEELERIERLKEREKVIETFSQSFSMAHSEEQIINPLFLDLDDRTGEQIIQVHDKITAKLKDHQRQGVQFMWNSCYESVERLKKHNGSGCILAHCMGLGKTFQVLALIHTLFNHEVTNTKHVLVVCPLSTVSNWKKEVKWAFKDIPEDKMFSVFTIGTRKENSNKYEIVKKWQQRKKALLVLGYEGFENLTNETKLDKICPDQKPSMLEALIDPGPDLVICDEGHLLRNKKALKSKALNKIRTKRRIVLTGTPLQNNLNEYYHMVQIVKPNLLGNSKEFKTNFVNPITNGQYEDSTEDDIRLMMKRTHVLHRLLAKTVQRVEDSELELYLPKMVDHAVFIQLTQSQIDLYNHFSELMKRNKDNKNTHSFLVDFKIFQYICTHPHLIAVMENLNKKKIKERDLITNEDDHAVSVCITKDWWKGRLPHDSYNKIEYGNKLVVMKSIIEECEEIGDKVLVFSQCLGELDLIEHFLKTDGTRKCASWQKKLDYYRMDGTVSPEDRTFICDKFNNLDNPRMRLLLMSTKVGGLGLNLTAANRVIIMTVNWNPSYDTQSVFRVYRFGQQKAVYVYRLISLDTMEEKVYQRGVTKLAIAHRVVDKHQITNHYQRMHLQELYTCKPNADNERPTPNVPEDQLLAKLILRLPYIFKYHEHKALLANRPEINLSKEELSSAWQAWKDRENAPKPAPPPPKSLVPTIPQKSIQTGPDFNNAYNLTRSNLNTIANMNRNSSLAPTAEQMNQYYISFTQQNGTYSYTNAPNPFSNQHIPNGGPLNLTTKEPSRLTTPNNQVDKFSNRMRPYIPDQTKNRLPAPTVSRGPDANETIVSAGPSFSIDAPANAQIGYPTASTSVRSSDAAKGSRGVIKRFEPVSTDKVKPSSAINRRAAANETIVSSAASLSKDGVASAQIGYPTASTSGRSSDAAKELRRIMRRIEPITTNNVKPNSVVAKNVAAIATSMATGNRLQQNKHIPVTSNWNKRITEYPKTNTNAASDSPSEMRFVEVRKPQFSSPKPILTLVPKLVASKIGKNPVNIPRINPGNSMLVLPSGLMKANKKIPNKNTGPNVTNRVVAVKTSNQNRPSTSVPFESISNPNTRVAKRKLDQRENDSTRIKRVLLTSTNSNKGHLTPAELKEKLVRQRVSPGTINHLGKKDTAPQTSESASLSNNLLRLGQSGVTIRKVSDERDVITLD